MGEDDNNRKPKTIEINYFNGRSPYPYDPVWLSYFNRDEIFGLKYIKKLAEQKGTPGEKSQIDI